MCDKYINFKFTYNLSIKSYRKKIYKDIKNE